MIEFIDAAPVRATNEEIIIDGKVVGEIWKRTEGDYQCTIKPPAMITAMHQAFHGIGGTKELAIKDALETGIKERDCHTAGIEWLEARI